MKAIIIDNEINIIQGLQILLKEYCPQIVEIHSATNIEDGYNLINKVSPDIVFLDIELDEGTGLELLDKIRKIDFQLIFITAFDQYAVDAFKYSAIDYLLKPIDPDDLVNAVSKAKDLIERESDHLKFQVLINNLKNVSGNSKKIIVSDRDNIYSVELNSILYLQADGPYTKIKRFNDFIFTSKNLKHFENLLSYAGFYRIHHGFLANLDHMKRFDKVDSVLEMQNGERIPVSVRKKEGLLTAIKGQLFR